MSHKQRNSNSQILVACQLNVNGLSLHSKLGVERFILKRGISILALQETRVHDLKENLFSGMKTYVNSHGQGAAISVSTTLKPTFVKELSDNTATTVWVSVEIDRKTVLLCSAYCNPEVTGTQSLDNALRSLEKARSYGKKYGIKSIIVFGDFNARSAMWGDRLENPRWKVLRDYISQSSITTYSYPNSYTFVTRNGGSLIDIALSSGWISNQMGKPWIVSHNIHELFTEAPDKGHLPTTTM